MSWNYSGSPSASPLDEVRFLSGDTVEGPHSVSDEEIGYLLAQGNSVLETAALVAEQSGRYFSTKSDKTVGSLSISYSSRAGGYFDVAARLRARAKGNALKGFSGPVLLGGGPKYLGTTDEGMEPYN